MNKFGHGQTGGGGVRPRQNEPPHAGGHGGYGGQRDRSQRDQTVAQFWPRYLEGGYFDADGNLKIEYVSRCLPGDEVLEPSKQRGLETIARMMSSGRPPLTTAQLRRFFMHCRRIETELKSGASWNSVRPRFQFLNSAAEDAHGKEPKKIPSLFCDFICRNVAAVKSEKDFLRGFLPHFEALVGFATPHLAKERN
jgi:hypothetical protein